MDKKLDAARRELTNRVMGKPGVSGTAVGERGGKPCLVVMVSDGSLKKVLPKEERVAGSSSTKSKVNFCCFSPMLIIN